METVAGILGRLERERAMMQRALDALDDKPEGSRLMPADLPAGSAERAWVEKLLSEPGGCRFLRGIPGGVIRAHVAMLRGKIDRIASAAFS